MREIIQINKFVLIRSDQISMVTVTDSFEDGTVKTLEIRLTGTITRFELGGEDAQRLWKYMLGQAVVLS